MSQGLRTSILKETLRPIVRFALSGSEKIQDLIDILKELFIEEGHKELLRRNPGKKVSMSKLNIMTGVHRIDAARIHKHQEDLTRKAPTLISRVLSLWENDPRFLTSAGRPRVLPLLGADPSFETLTLAVSDHLPLKPTLEELKRMGVIEETARGFKLIRAIHYLGKSDEAKITFLGENMQSLISAATENVASNTYPPHAHFRTSFDRIPSKHSKMVKSWLFEESKKIHERVRKYLSKLDVDTGTKKGSPKEEPSDTISFVSVSYALENDEGK